MSYFTYMAHDAALQVIEDATDRLVFLSAYPTTYAEVTTFLLGYKADPIMVSPEAREDGGRQLRIPAFTDGITEASGDAEFWALVNDTVDFRVVVGRLKRKYRLVAGQPLVLDEDLLVEIPADEDAA